MKAHNLQVVCYCAPSGMHVANAALLLAAFLLLRLHAPPKVEYGTSKRVKARFWPWLAGKSP